MEGQAGRRSRRERDFFDEGSDEDLSACQTDGVGATQYGAHGAPTQDHWVRRPPEPEPAPLEPEPALLKTNQTIFDLEQLHSSMESRALQDASAQHELELPEATLNSRRSAEQDGGCPATCVKYGWWPLAFLLGSLFAVVYITGKAAHASVISQAERDQAAELAQRKRARYEQQHAALKQAARADDEGVDVVAILFLAAALCFGVYCIYAYCTRPQDNTRHGLPTQEAVEDEARACRAATEGAHGELDDDDDDTAALVSAFEACDVDGSGQIDAAEFHAILAAIGTGISLQRVKDIVEECEQAYVNFAHVSKYIRKVPLLALLPEWQLRQIAETIRTVEYQVGDVVIEEGQSGEEMFLVEEGTLSCTKAGIHHGKTLRTYSAGEFFGERALLVHERRAATITALTKCILHKLPTQSCQGKSRHARTRPRAQATIALTHT